jgi:pimeloyl-ACP methyl ester carboxylesterase
VKQSLRDNAWTVKNLLVDLDEPLDCAQVRRIPVPVLLVTGEKSPAIYGEMLKGLRECLRRFENATVPGASHGMARTHAAAFNAVVLRFMAGN